MNSVDRTVIPYRARYIESRLREFWKHFPIVAVLGARQVGKSRLVQEVLGKRVKTIVFDPVQDVGGARQDPDLFLQNHPAPLFLDEVQYAPELLPALKRRVDERPGAGRYILSGSQNLMVLRSIAESLAGRVAILNLPPMGYAELRGQAASATDNLARWVRGKGFADTTEPPPAWSPALWRGG